MLKAKNCLIGKLNQVIQKVYPQLQSKTATPSEEVQVIEADSGVYGLKKVTINEIPSEYVIPTGSVNITSNGNHNVSGKETANVNVQFTTQSKTVTPTKQTQNILPDENIDALSKVTVNPIPNEYIVPVGTLNINESGNYDVTDKANANVNVQFVTQTKTATPTKQTQEITPDDGKDGLNKVTINPIPNEYIIPSGTKDITTNGTQDVTNYANVNVNVQASTETKTVKSTTTTQTINPTSGKLINQITVQPIVLDTVTVTPTTSSQTITPTNDGLGQVNVNPIPSEYIIPTGTVNITENGTVDVTNYASANVSVGGGEKLEDYFTMTIDSNTGLNDNYVTRGMLKKPYRISCTNEITDLGNAFTNYPLEYIDVSGLDLSNVTSANYMFSQCSSLKEIVFGNVQFNSNIDSVASMFASSNNLIKLDLSNVFASTNKVYTFNSMFYGTNKLAALDISSFVFNAGVIITTSNMFYNCGTQCLQSDGAYADGIPYIFVKDTAAQNYILSLSGTRRPASWTSANVVVAGGPDDPRT